MDHVLRRDQCASQGGLYGALHGGLNVTLREGLYDVSRGGLDGAT